MKKLNVLGNILFCLTLISPCVAFSWAAIIGEAEIFGIGGILRYIWLMLLFIPIGMLSILIGLKLKKENLSYKKNLIIAFICLPLLVIFGSYRFIFQDMFVYDNYDKLLAVEDITGLDLPDQIDAITEKSELYETTCAKIIDEESIEAFEEEIKNNHLWQSSLHHEIKSLLPMSVQYECVLYDCFVFYNVTTGEYNTGLKKRGEYEPIYIAYDRDLHRLLILDSYEINLELLSQTVIP